MLRCFDLEGIHRFADRADAYARGRPSYPADAIAFVRAQGSGVILDVGAGTGISTRLLQAIAVDPSLEMLGASGVPTAVQARAEALPFASGSAGLLTSFNAFHWFQPEPFFAEAHRVLRDGGKLVLAWNDWNLDDPFTAEFFRMIREHATGIPPEDRAAEVAPLYATQWFGNVVARRFPNEHVLDLELLLFRLQSISYIPNAGAAWDAVARRAEELFGRYAKDGRASHLYDTSVYVAERGTTGGLRRPGPRAPDPAGRHSLRDRVS